MFLLDRRGHFGPRVRHTRLGSIASSFVSLLFSLSYLLSSYPLVFILGDLATRFSLAVRASR